MAQDRFPLRINAGFLINAPISTSREINFDLSSISLGSDLNLKTLVGKVELTRTPKGILVEAGFSATMQAECVRCLDEFDQLLRTDFSELYAFHANSVTDSGLIVPEDGNIDLLPLLREYLLIEVPIKTVCREDCQGLCIICGENLNHQTCEHQAEKNRSDF
ncbi:YceD family protein [Leptolinea tardivitalis]|uniref:YceD family protein n=1 Tax=Leptolinea tardivitalis TaxID=229920 RepID=UPI0007804105|nr:DUF177 domain-containing protein [Leptolinea tardivitalis]GAP22280.1 predicted metal-binding, possibly nucleic acid-binding protein [Leptolinea tardivitalis]